MSESRTRAVSDPEPIGEPRLVQLHSDLCEMADCESNHALGPLDCGDLAAAILELFAWRRGELQRGEVPHANAP